mmetsp:Transcript_21992/g.86400  ORF Transcript_21992/g.86400 Transcript_21992/m.86400 type:complete len:307 (+) Transcript_21992:641-1561(+)
MPSFTGDGVGERDLARQQLQRRDEARRVLVRQQHRVDAVADDGQAERVHLRTQLVARTGQGPELIARKPVGQGLDEVNAGLGVRLTVDHLHLHELLAIGFDEAVPDRARPGAGAQRRDGLVDLADAALAEQLVVGVTVLAPQAEHNQAGRLAVQPVNRNQIGQAGGMAQACHQGLAGVQAARRDGQEVGLVGDQQVLVLEHDARLERHPRLHVERAPVVDPPPAAVGRVGDGPTRVVDHMAAGQPLGPVEHPRQALGEEGGERRPRPGRAEHRARGHAVAQRQHGLGRPRHGGYSMRGPLRPRSSM